MSEQPIPLTDTERERGALAAVIYEDDSRAEWLRTVDGSPNSASYEFARRVLESDWLADRERDARAAALAPIQALAKQWQENARANARAGHFPWAMWQERANDLFAVLAAAGVDAAPNETTTEDGLRHLWRSVEPPTVGEQPTAACGVVRVKTEVAADDPVPFCPRCVRGLVEERERLAAYLRDLHAGGAAVPSGHEQEGDHRG